MPNPLGNLRKISYGEGFRLQTNNFLISILPHVDNPRIAVIEYLTTLRQGGIASTITSREYVGELVERLREDGFSSINYVADDRDGRAIVRERLFRPLAARINAELSPAVNAINPLAQEIVSVNPLAQEIVSVNTAEMRRFHFK